VHALRGMYAFGIWDKRERRIVLGVDFLGIKPLYYLNDENWFAWSSEVKPLLLLPGVIASLDESALHEFVCYRSLSGARTMFKGIYRLTPSQILVYDPARDLLESSTHWHPEAFALASQTVPVEEVRETLRESVREHARADVPIGVQLSGGLDSSLVARLLRDALPRDYALHSYCIGPTDSGFGEFGYARRAARAAGTIHHEIRFDATTFAQSLHKATLHLDEPLNHPNTVPLMHLAGAARSEVKVLFSGEGADELFCGYKRHARFLREPASVARLAGSNQVNHIDLANSVFRRPGHELAPERLSFARAVSDASPARQLTLYDLHHHLPALLLRQDKMGMSANLEIRVPYLDKRLVEMALALTDSQKITASNRKVALRAAAAGAIPRSIAGRLKRGFGLPVSRWLRSPVGLGPMLERLLLDERRRTFLNYAAIARLYAEHQGQSKDNSDILWPLLSLEVWCRCFLDGESPQANADLGGALRPVAMSCAQ
jgi:asparagine synthase (glutamine-hydrolysing)